MTTSDDVYAQKAELARKLGIEQTKYDQLRLDYDNLMDTYNQAVYQNRDLVTEVKRLTEKLEDLRR